MGNRIDLAAVLERSELAVPDSYGQGREARQVLQLDEMDRQQEAVTVSAPEDVRAMSPEFLVGLLQPSVEHFGSADQFFAHYQFEGDPYLISQIRRVVDYSLLDDTATVIGGKRR